MFGWMLWKKHRIDLVNAWHTRNVKQEDVPAYTKLMGLSLIAIGAGCLVTGIVACIKVMSLYCQETAYKHFPSG